MTILERESARLVLFVPVAFAAGDAVYLSLLREPAFGLAPAGLIAAAAAALLFRNRLALCFLLSLTASGFAGGCWTQWTARQVSAPVLPAVLDPCLIEGRVLELIPLERGGARVILAADRIEPAPALRTPRRVRINLHGSMPQLEPGDAIRLKAALMPPPAPLVPGGFEIARALWFQGIGAVGFAYGPPRLLSRAAPSRNRLARLRHRIAARIQFVLPGATGGVANAILTGTKGHIPAAEADHLRDAGLAHLLVVAGMHMGFVAGFVFLVLRGGLALVPAVALRYPIKKWAAFATVIACLLYLVLTGAAPPTQRAFVMILMVMTAILFDRRAFSMRMLALAAMTVLIAAPEAVTGPSFQMSFAAVGCLIAAHESGWLAGHAARSNGLGRALAHLGTIAVTTVIAGFATEPYAAYHFNHIALYSVPANLFAVPITAFWSMPLGLIALIAMPLGYDAPVLSAMGLGIDAVLWASRELTALPGAVGHVPAMPVSSLLCFSAGLVWICLWQLPWRWLGAVPIAAASWLWYQAPRPDLLIDAGGSTMAVREADGILRLAPGRVKSASAETWLERDGQTPDASARRAALSCRPESCDWRAPNGTTIRWNRQGPMPLSSPQFELSRDELARNGALSLRYRGGEPILARAVPLGLDRPWARSIVAANETDQTALDFDAVGSENPRLIGRIGGLERD